MFNFVAEPSYPGSLRSALKLVRNWLFSRPDPAPVHTQIKAIRPSGAAASAKTSTARLSATEQWSRVSGVLMQSDKQAHHARDLQARALQQIDLATYAFNSIIDEIATVMDLPARRELAVVHLFEPAHVRSHERGAVAANRAA